MSDTEQSDEDQPKIDTSAIKSEPGEPGEIGEPGLEESPEEKVPEDKPMKWWLGTSIAGRPTFVEIVKIGPSPVSEMDDSEPPEFGPDDDLIIDRGVQLGQVMTQQGPGQGFVDIRQSFGPAILMPSDGNMSKKASRPPLQIKGRSLLIGPYIWLSYGNPNYQTLWDQIEGVYMTNEELEKLKAENPQQGQKPIIAGPDGRAINQSPGQGGLEAFRGLAGT